VNFVFSPKARLLCLAILVYMLIFFISDFLISFTLGTPPKKKKKYGLVIKPGNNPIYGLLK
jgi:hypothetical protein